MKNVQFLIYRITYNECMLFSCSDVIQKWGVGFIQK
nr:MAG TPA: hypothetical protein [Caudoviricetes sp.]